VKKLLAAFVAGLIVMAGGGYWWLHRAASGDEPPGETHGGLFTKTETIAVGEVVNDIRRLERLVIFRAYITATTTTKEGGWFTESDQTMITPAFVNYYIDLSAVKPEDVRVRGNQIVVRRPQLQIERPNIDMAHLEFYNKGIWTNLSSTTDRLWTANRRMAAKQLVQRANMPFLVDAAKAAANAGVAANIRAALVAAGHPEIEVKVVR
jgi:hypothetical protein